MPSVALTPLFSDHPGNIQLAVQECNIPAWYGTQAGRLPDQMPLLVPRCKKSILQADRLWN